MDKAINEPPPGATDETLQWLSDCMDSFGDIRDVKKHCAITLKKDGYTDQEARQIIKWWEAKAR